MKNEIRIKSLERGFEIIEALVEEGECSLTALSDGLDIPPSSLHDYLSTLTALGYVARTGNVYRVSTEFLYMGVSAREQLPIYKHARPEVDKLAAETGEHVSIMVEESGYGSLLYIQKGESGLDLGVSVGYRMHLQTTAPGKAILAYLPEERVERILEERGLPKKTEATITDRETLYDALETIRDRGYATDLEERVEGVRAVAAPIVARGSVHGAIAISGPANRMSGEWFQEELPETLLRVVNVIEIKYTLG